MLQRWYRLRTAEQPAELLAFEPEFRALTQRLLPGRFSLALVMTASSLARAGYLDQARQTLHQWHQSQQLGPDFIWWFFLGEVCFLTQEPAIAQQGYDLLLPKADLFFQAGYAGMCQGPR